MRLGGASRLSSPRGSIPPEVRPNWMRTLGTQNYYVAFGMETASLPGSIIEGIVNTELCKQALAKVGNPNLLINLISRRVRQLNAGGGGLSRPLVENTTHLGASDIALREIIEEKMSWELEDELQLLEDAPHKRRRKR